MISVVIPVHNHGAFVEGAVDAFLRQTRPPREIVLVDDASTDDTAARIAGLAARHPAVRAVRLARNGGPNVAIQCGLKVATGAFVTAAAADDRVTPIFLARSVAALEAHPAAALCFSDPGELIAETGARRDHLLGIADGPAYFAPAALARLMRRNLFTISSNTVVYRREALDAVGGFRPELAWHADWFANLVLGFRHGACYVPAVLAYFRVTAGSYSWTGARDRAGQRRLLLDVIDVLRTEFPDVYPQIRRSALVPEMRLRDMGWLLGSPGHRRHLTARLAGRLLAREAWTHLRPMTPLSLRRGMRRLAGRATSPARGTGA
ncbi:MAG: glycosyltransferase [Alphaproteobacteria bacterium]